MIAPLLRLSWLALVRDRWALALSFLVPVAFFSILAFVFGGADREALPPVRVAVVDDDRSTESALFVAALEREAGLAIERLPDASPGGAQRAVERGDVAVAVVVPAGFGERFTRFPAETITLTVIGDRVADPVAQHVVAGLLQRAVIAAAPERLVQGLAGWVEDEAGPLTAAQRALVDDVGRSLADPGDAAPSPFRLERVDVRSGRGREGRNAVSYYAAAIGVMFLLFTLTTATRGLITEHETGTLERLLATEVTMGTLLGVRWLFATALGATQLAIMFVWGWAVFGLDLFAPGHLVGVATMTLIAAAAAAALGCALGAACRTQAQLQGLATVVILLMSALGGSMVPRYLMPTGMQQAGLLTFNAWAVRGFEKVLWYDAPLAALGPEVAVLGGMTLVALAVARWLARGWDVD